MHTVMLYDIILTQGCNEHLQKVFKYSANTCNFKSI